MNERFFCRRWTSVFVAICFAQAPAAPKDTKEETCRVSGMVVKRADGVPLKGATVRLENGEDREPTIATKTTGDGRFELRNVPAGRYKLPVSRNGYVETEHGQKKPSDPGARKEALGIRTDYRRRACGWR